MKYKMRKAALYATVTLSTMPLNIVAFQAAVASEPIIYTGSEADYNNLPSNPFSQTGKAIRPEASATQSGNTIVIYDGVGEENFIAPGAVLGGTVILATPIRPSRVIKLPYLGVSLMVLFLVATALAQMARC